MARATRRTLAFVVLMVSAGILLAGCISIGTRLLMAALADPRTHNHAYNLKLEISFRYLDKQVKAIRYAEVGYLTGKGDSYHYPLCSPEQRSCWYITKHYFIGLPTGDIMDVYLDDGLLPLDRWPHGVTIAGDAHLAGIHRDQPPSQHSDSRGTCLSLDSDIVLHDYGFPATSRIQSEVKYDIALTWVEDREAKVIDPEGVYTAMIIDAVSCKRLHARVSHNVVITPVGP